MFEKDAGISRRKFLKNIIAGVGIAATGIGITACDDDDALVIPEKKRAPYVFTHGVASGDPLKQSVILWTRITHPELSSIKATWEVATDDSFASIVSSGTYTTTSEEDYTVKVDASGLIAGTKYYYRFRIGDQTSITGTTQTLPNDTNKVKMAAFSCANYPAGYFNVYAEAAKDDELDVVLHLGDYIYEYDKAGYASADAATLGRVAKPENETISLSDYRTRYAQYRTDKDLLSLHKKKAFICVWDDHEIANDAYTTGAENHDENTEGAFEARKAAALRAYYEWLPVREPSNGKRENVYRSFDFGQLISLHMLDTRLVGRDKQLDYANYIDSTTGAFDATTFTTDLTNPDRQLLGAEQTAWLHGKIQTSTATWQILGQQILMGSMNVPAPLVTFQITFNEYLAIVTKAQTDPTSLTDQEKAILAQPSIPYNLDAWDGYAAAREAVYFSASSFDKNLIVLSGDTHNAWASNLTDRNDKQIGVEFATSSVSSPGFEAVFPNENPDMFAAGLVQLISGLQYANTQHRGYLTLTVTAAEAIAEWQFVDTVKSKDYSVLSAYGKTLKVLSGAGNRKIVSA